MPGSKEGKEGVARGKMQTEEETATAEEPILEEGSGREQVRKDIFLRLNVCLLTFRTKTSEPC